MKSTLIVILLLVSAASLQAQQLSERLIANAFYISYGGAYYRTDSSAYSYSGHRSIDSTWNFPYLAFDQHREYSDYRTTGTMSPHQYVVKTYDAMSRLLSDTTYRAWDSATAHFKVKSINDYAYDTYGWPASTLVHTDTGTGVMTTVGKVETPHDSTGRILRRDYVISQTGGSSWDTATTQEWWIYGNSGRADTFFMHFSNGRGQRQIFYYDSIGRLSSHIEDDRNSDTSAWHSTWITNVYAPSGYLAEIHFLTHDTAWHDREKYTYTYDPFGNQISFLITLTDTFGHWLDYKRTDYTYDGYFMLTYAVTQHVGGFGLPNDYDEKDYYYYRVFDPRADITTIPNTGGEAHIYPLPAADMVSIDIKWDEAQAATILITDATGRPVYQSPAPSAASYHGYLPLADLPPGVYALSARGEKGSITKLFNVIR